MGKGNKQEITSKKTKKSEKKKQNGNNALTAMIQD